MRVALILSLLILPLTGCMYVSKDWYPKPTADAPWVAPNVKAVWQERIWQMAFAPAWHPEHRWADAAGKGVADADGKAPANYLAGTVICRRWPDAPPVKNVPAHKDPPYDFAVVALKPAIIVMWPHQPNLRYDGDYGTLSLYPMTGARGISTLPPVETLLWFSPDLRIEPTPPASIDPTHARIAWRGGRLNLERTAFGWTTTRE